MGLDYKILIVLGAKVKVEESKEIKLIPRYSEETGERIEDKEIKIDFVKIHNFDKIHWEKIRYSLQVEKDIIPELKDLIFFTNSEIVGEIVAKSDYVRGGNSIDLEIPTMEDWKSSVIKSKLTNLGLSDFKLFSVLIVSY